MTQQRPPQKYCTVSGQNRIAPDQHLPQKGTGDWNEVEQTYTPAAAQKEASRCLATLVCTYCEVCQLMCPDLCITRDPETGHIHFDLTYCKACGICAHFCPKGAIEMVPE